MLGLAYSPVSKHRARYPRHENVNRFPTAYPTKYRMGQLFCIETILCSHLQPWRGAMSILHQSQDRPVIRRRSTVQLPGDYRPLDPHELQANMLARVYALILSWSMEDSVAIQMEEQTA